jgi:hypothetical protein
LQAAEKVSLPAWFLLDRVMVWFQWTVFAKDAFLFLCSDDCRMVTGSRLHQLKDEFQLMDVELRLTARDRHLAANPSTPSKYRHPKSMRRKNYRVRRRRIE